MAAVPGQGKPAPMTTERIQEMLEENFKFIKAIAEQQNLGRVQDVNQFQQKLQENLMLLAAVADAYANTSATGGAVQPAAPAMAQAGRPPTGPSPAPAAAAAGAQYPGGPLQPQPQQQQNPLMMVMPGAQPAGVQQPAVQLTQQQIQAAVQQLARQQQQQQQQQQQFQMPQALQQQQQLGQGQQLGGQQGVGGFQLPAPPPLNLGM